MAVTLRVFKRSTKRWRATKRSTSTCETERGNPPIVNTISRRIEDVSVHEFREIAFKPQLPLLIKSRGMGTNRPNTDNIPATLKWFSQRVTEPGDSSAEFSQTVPSSYLLPFSSTILPYELFIEPRNEVDGQTGTLQNPAQLSYETITETLGLAPELKPGTFHTFEAPLGLFLALCKAEAPNPLLQRLYIAQARVSDLPPQLQDDLPTPRIVKEAGKGDIYDANLWMGLPPTYTPLHRDPNPNFFVQLAGSKRVRLFNPDSGFNIFRHVLEKNRRSSSVRFRGKEMMEGPERAALDEDVWAQAVTRNGFEATVKAGEALFIPKGWWHSIKSSGPDLSASVNWWFR